MSNPIIRRAEAQRLGLKRFYTGWPCANRHWAERYTSNGKCTECNRARSRARTRSRTPEQRLHARLRRISFMRDIPLHELPPMPADGRCELCGEVAKRLDHDHDHEAEELGLPGIYTHRAGFAPPVTSG